MARGNNHRRGAACHSNGMIKPMPLLVPAADMRSRGADAALIESAELCSAVEASQLLRNVVAEGIPEPASKTVRGAHLRSRAADARGRCRSGGHHVGALESCANARGGGAHS